MTTFGTISFVHSKALDDVCTDSDCNMFTW